MQNIVVTLVSLDGVRTQKTYSKPNAKPVQLSLPAGTQATIEIQQVPGASGAAKPEGAAQLLYKRVGDRLLVVGDQEVLVDIADYYTTAGASVDYVSWDYSGQTQLVLHGAAAQGLGVDQAAVGLSGTGATATETSPIPLNTPLGAGSAATEPVVAGASVMPSWVPLLGVGVAAAATGANLSAALTAAANNQVTGVIAAGPVLPGNDLQVEVYGWVNGARSLLKTVDVDEAGKFTADIGSYTGPIVVKVVNPAGGTVDYADEATATDKDLSADLFAAGVGRGGLLTLNINALTTVAARKAEAVDAAGTLALTTAAKIDAANTLVAKVFGLTDITTTAPDTFNPQDKDGVANDLGKVLAALSGMDKNNGGDAKATINQLAGALESVALDQTTPALDAPTQAKVVAGASAAQTAIKAGNPDLNLIGDISDGLSKAASTAGTVSGVNVTIDPIAGDDVLLASEANAGVTLRGTVTAGADVILTIGTDNKRATVTGTSWELVLDPNPSSYLGADGAKFLVASATLGTVSSSASRAFMMDITAPSTPTLALGTGVTNGATAAEATQAGGVATVNAESGSNVSVTFSSGSNTVTKLLPGTGSAQAVVLTAQDLAILGDGSVTVSAVATDAAGNASAASTSNLTLDTSAPATPTLALGSGVTNGATVAEATQAGGAVTVNAENGSSVAVTFTNGSKTVTKTVPGTGAAQAVVLTAQDLTTLGDGTVTVSAVATDVAGNASSAGTSSFTLDTSAPATPTLTLGAGVNDGATAAEATQAGGVVTVNAENGSSVAVTFTNGSKTVTKPVPGTGTAQAVVLTVQDLTTLGDGRVTVSAVATDVAGNASSAGTSSFTLDTSAPAAPTLALGTGVSGGATSTEATQAGGVVTVNAENGSSVLVTFTNGTKVVTKPVPGTGSPQAVVLTADEVAMLGDGTVTVSAIATDVAGNPSSAGTSSFALDTVTPAVTMGMIAGDNTINASEVTSVIIGTCEAGASVSLSIGGNNRVATVSGTSWIYTLTAPDINALGQGSGKTITATATDAAGNTATASQSVTVDTVAPVAPTLALGTGVTNGATAAEAIQAGGVVTVNAENGANVAVTFTRGANTVTKPVPGTGGAQAVVLTAQDLATLGDGTVTVSAVVTDQAGNVSSAGTSSFTLDTSVPATPTLTLGSGVSSGATAAEATQAGGVVTVNAESGANVAVTFTNGSNTLTKTMPGTGSALGRVNTNGDRGDCIGQSRAWRSRPHNSPLLSTACPSSVATSA